VFTEKINFCTTVLRNPLKSPRLAGCTEFNRPIFILYCKKLGKIKQIQAIRSTEEVHRGAEGQVQCGAEELVHSGAEGQVHHGAEGLVHSGTAVEDAEDAELGLLKHPCFNCCRKKQLLHRGST